MLMMRTAVIAAVMAVGIVAHGECVLRPLKDYVADDRVAAVLQARVASLQSPRNYVRGQIATVEVQRLWKGESKREATLYNLYDSRGAQVEGQVTLRQGETYFIVARALTPTELAALGVSGLQLGTSECNSWDLRFVQKQILADAPGYPPRQ